MIEPILNRFLIKYPFIPIIILPIIEVLAADNNTNISNDPLDNTPSKKRDFRSVVDFTLTMIVLGNIGCFYVFYRAYKQWILSRKRLAMIYKLPFYTACTDFLINCSFLANILHTAIYKQVWGEPSCKILSAVNWAFVTLNLSFYGVIATMTYLRICHEVYFHYGNHDYKLWLIVIIVDIALQALNITNHGARKFWCAGRAGQIRSPIILFSIISLVLMIILFCYIKIYRRILYSKRNSLATSASGNGVGSAVLEKRAEIESKAAKKILSYIMVFIIQWIPMQVSLAARFVNLSDEVWVYIIASLGRSFGGVANAIQYIVNEGWFTHESTDYDSQTETNKEMSNNYNFIELNKIDTINTINTNNSGNSNNENNNNILLLPPMNTEHSEIKLNISDNYNTNNTISAENSNQV